MARDDGRYVYDVETLRKMYDAGVLTLDDIELQTRAFGLIDDSVADVSQPCPSAGLYPRSIPQNMPTDLRDLPLCVCRACGDRYMTGHGPDVHALLERAQSSLGIAFGAWAVLWCVVPRKSKRVLADEAARLAALDSIVRMCEGDAAKRAVEAVVRASPWG